MSNIKNIKKQILLIIVTIMAIYSCANSREQAVPIIANFDITIINNDYSVPVQVQITNTTEGAQVYNWTFEGGTPTSSTNKNPGTVVYNEAGDYTIFLEATNQDGSIDTKEVTIPIDAAITTGFSTEIIESNYPPMEVVVTNNTIGATSYNWIFEGGNPSISTEENPENIIFNEPGEHQITLEVTNGLETYEVTETVTVAPNLVADFEYETSYDDTDLQVPVTFSIYNKSISATDYVWTFNGSNQTTTTTENATITFDTPGTYNLVLEATNGKETKEITKEITVVENTNLRVYKAIKLGINTTHTNNTIGAFFATQTGEVYTKEEVSEENGALIDIVFFGLNEEFTFNKFISPKEATNLTFDEIPNAISTTIINKQETCNCNVEMTSETFDTMEDDTALENLTLTTIAEELQDFDNTITPRIILFETEDGRKGAIKINEFIKDGVNSHIIVDIKVQKE